jgi:hemoglobin
MMKSTMFERYGGFAEVRRIVSDFYDKVLESPILSPFFCNTDMKTLVDHQSQFISQVMGGPVRYSSEALERTHARLGIDSRALDTMISLLLETLEDHEVTADDIATIEAELRQLSRFIVTRH